VFVNIFIAKMKAVLQRAIRRDMPFCSTTFQ